MVPWQYKGSQQTSSVLASVPWKRCSKDAYRQTIRHESTTYHLMGRGLGRRWHLQGCKFPIRPVKSVSLKNPKQLCEAFSLYY